MSLNLHCEGFYQIPFQIGTYESQIIYSDNDGGTIGVLKRLKLFFLLCKQKEQNDKKISTYYKKELSKYWDEHIYNLDNIICQYKKKQCGLKFSLI